jgi:uncharacterized protein
MAVVRILIDGYNLIYAWQRCSKFRRNQGCSLLHKWPELAPGKPRYSMEARDELIRVLTLYRDATHTPITIVFDGAGKTANSQFPSTPDLEILYSRSGQTADQIIERVAVRMAAYGEVLAVTDDFAERDTVFYHGGMSSSCASFIEDVERTLQGQTREIALHNRRQKAAFKAPK